MTQTQSYSVNAFDEIVITATRHASNHIHYQFATPGEKSVVIHAFDSTTELTTQEAFKRAYAELAHWVGVKAGYDHLQRNDAIPLLISVARDLFVENIFKDMKDLSGEFLHNGVSVNWKRTLMMDVLLTSFETQVSDHISEDGLGVRTYSKIELRTHSKEDNLSPSLQYAEYAGVFDRGPTL
ncbi:hypothetical protein FDH97_gp212 [Erwinia phage vB_EamM_Deimos-Minion]|uniref:Uncharacterized protein n=1 Tax=Erwinia phage vB_EamM_Deimos-Minion TaxID=1815986 RepID=A0A173GF71_9CAUD|nr:hypothetical protein FDH97_gp212 [Erwinia phage vB_EamM_Deimos-Minion]ANH52312.1 hypothetical protein DM_212 [Erwinia phage vB_EamM_Deimos-Minion]